MDALLAEVLKAHGGTDRWSRLTSLTARVSIGGPIWAVKGWPDALLDETVEIDTRHQRSVFSPFAGGRRMVFDTAPELVTIEGMDGRPDQRRHNPRDAFAGFERSTPWDALHLGYFVGYAFWNYFASPFAFLWPGVVAHEITPWHEQGETWRRLRVSFPESVATHNPEQVFYYDTGGLQRRMDYVTELLGNTPVAHYTTRHESYGGIVVPTRRDVYRRNPDGTADKELRSITVDVRDVVVG